MGVDATLFVLASHSGYGNGFVSHVFTLDRDRDLWEPLTELVKNHKHQKWPQIQIPAGSWCNYSGEIPEGFDDREGGWLQDDCYGTEFWAFKASHLAKIKSEFSDLNNAMLGFVAKHFAAHDVVVFWH